MRHFQACKRSMLQECGLWFGRLFAIGGWSGRKRGPSKIIAQAWRLCAMAIAIARLERNSVLNPSRRRPAITDAWKVSLQDSNDWSQMRSRINRDGATALPPILNRPYQKPSHVLFAWPAGIPKTYHLQRRLLAVQARSHARSRFMIRARHECASIRRFPSVVSALRSGRSVVLRSYGFDL